MSNENNTAARFVAKDDCSSAAPSAVWCVENKTCSALYATEDLARAYVAKFPASVGGGIQVTRIDVIGVAPASPAASPAVSPIGVLTDAELIVLIDAAQAEWGTGNVDGGLRLHVVKSVLRHIAGQTGGEG